MQRGILLATSNNGDIDLSTPSGVLTATIKTAVSEHEISMMKIRMSRAANRRPSGVIPKWKRAFGYLGRHLPARPAHRTAGQAGVRRGLAGSSITDIARICNDAGASTG